MPLPGTSLSALHLLWNGAIVHNMFRSCMLCKAQRLCGRHLTEAAPRAGDRASWAVLCVRRGLCDAYAHHAHTLLQGGKTKKSPDAIVMLKPSPQTKTRTRDPLHRHASLNIAQETANPLTAASASQVIIMSNACDVCGYRNSEVKPGGGFSERGTQITLQVPNRVPCVIAMQKGKSEPCRRTARHVSLCTSSRWTWQSLTICSISGQP